MSMPHRESPLSRLPFDVWSKFASLVSKTDLVHLCATSSTFLSIFRPLLYRAVALGRGDWTLTFDLLARNETLASAVVHLELLHRRTEFGGPRIVNLRAIANLTALRGLTLTCCLFRDDADISEFWKIIASRPIQDLEYLYSAYSHCRCQPPYDDRCGNLGGLKIIRWTPSRTEQINPLPCLLSGSLQTLSRLSLPPFAFEDAGYRPLVGMRFPNLLSLTVYYYDRRGDELAPMAVLRTFTQFLLSNDTIEELALGEELSFDVSLLSPNSLPRLRCFRGHPVALDALVKTRSAGAFRELHLQFMLDAENSANQLEVFTTLRSSPPMLQHIGIYHFHMPISFFVQVIGECARLFGSTLVEFNIPMILEEMKEGLVIAHASVFRQFKKLRVFDLHIGGGWVHPSEVDAFRTESFRRVLPFIRAMADICPTLEEIRVELLAIDWKHTWLITRTPDSCDGLCPSDYCDAHFLYVPSQPTPSFGCVSSDTT